MKHLIFCIILFTFSNYFSQNMNTPLNAWVEIYLVSKSTDIPISNTIFSMESVSQVWGGGNLPGTNDYDNSYTWLTNDYDLLSYESIDDDQIHSGWDFVRSPDFGVPIYGFGKYKLSVGNNFIYLDYRDDRCGFYPALQTTGHAIDIWVKFNHENNSFYINSYGGLPLDPYWSIVDLGSTITIWTLKGMGSPNTGKFEPYPPEDLTVSLENGKPRLNWQHHLPAEDYWIGYKIYRCITTNNENPVNFEEITTLSKNTTTFLDSSLPFTNWKNIHYKVVTQNTYINSQPSNTVQINITNEIINGTKYLNSNLIVPSGKSLTISSGTLLYFAPSTNLQVNGTLTAEGNASSTIIFTRSGSSGTWGGIQFNSGASGTLSYCTIQNAQNGVYGNGYLPNITNSTIANNNIGINLYNTGVQTNNISNNTIRYNTTHGINLTNSSPRNISGNQIYNNGQAGIYCINSSTPYIYNNQITGNSAAGITCALYSPARLGSYSGGGGYNLITGNNWGVGCGYESHAILGTTAGYGYNSIHSNTSHEVKSEYDSNVMAENNWWNRTTPPYYIASDFYTAYGGTIDYNPALSYNPLGGLMKTTSSEYNYDITNEERGFSFLDSELREALNNLIKGQYEEAILIYSQRYKKENDIGKKKYILGRLAECYNLSEKEGFIFFLNNDVRINSEGELIRKDELYAT